MLSFFLSPSVPPEISFFCLRTCCCVRFYLLLADSASNCSYSGILLSEGRRGVHFGRYSAPIPSASHLSPPARDSARPILVYEHSTLRGEVQSQQHNEGVAGHCVRRTFAVLFWFIKWYALSCALFVILSHSLGLFRSRILITLAKTMSIKTQLCEVILSDRRCSLDAAWLDMICCIGLDLVSDSWLCCDSTLITVILCTDVATR
jgi:hypothetical protein